jgi:hypothetical protein
MQVPRLYSKHKTPFHSSVTAFETEAEALQRNSKSSSHIYKAKKKFNKASHIYLCSNYKNISSTKKLPSIYTYSTITTRT